MYGEYLKMRPLYGINRPAGSLGRSQACNIALRYWGDKTITDEVLVTWLERLRDRNGWLSMGRKRPVPHESWFAVAGYFFYYGHYYASLCVEDLPSEKSTYLKNDLAHIMLALQEKKRRLVGLPSLQLSSTIRHRLCRHDSVALSSVTVGLAGSTDSTRRIKSSVG